jgi:hypothetical protein
VPQITLVLLYALLPFIGNAIGAALAESVRTPRWVTGAALHAARRLLGRCQIVVLDSQTVSLGLGILIETALRAAREDRSFEEIVRIVRGLIEIIGAASGRAGPHPRSEHP